MPTIYGSFFPSEQRQAQQTSATSVEIPTGKRKAAVWFGSAVVLVFVFASWAYVGPVHSPGTNTGTIADGEQLAEIIHSIEKVPQTDEIKALSSTRRDVIVISRNEYGTAPIHRYPFLQNMVDGGEFSNVLVEPYRETTLTAEHTASRTLQWNLDSNNLGMTVNVDRGSHEKVVTVSSSGLHELVLLDDDLNSYTVNLWCKYVRREIRSLTKSDRDEFLDTAVQLWQITTRQGRAEYGFDNNYVSIHKLALIHNDLAGNDFCDFLHGGLNFLGGHVALGNMFDKAMQQINPRVTLPYWSYTVDMAPFSNTDDNMVIDQGLWNSTVWGPDFFGYSSPGKGYITSGRWANITIPEVNEEFLNEAGVDGFFRTQPFYSCYRQEDGLCPDRQPSGHVRNAFGLLRSPWNLNAGSRMIRSHDNCGSTYIQFPSCSSVVDLQRHYDSFSDYVEYLMYSPHGTVHNFVGGLFGSCDHMFNAVRDNLGQDLADQMVLKANDLLKRFYQKSHSKAQVSWPDQGSCVGKKQSECGFECGSYNDTYTIIHELFVQNGVDYVVANLTLGERHFLVEQVCNANIMVGDMLDSGSPMDISFWVTHTEVERMWHRKALSGTMSSMTWDSSLYKDSCEGHHPDYIMHWNTYSWDASGDDHYGSSNNMTNEQYLAMINPAGDAYPHAIPYIYDSLNWTHCAAPDAGVGPDLMWDNWINPL